MATAAPHTEFRAEVEAFMRRTGVGVTELSRGTGFANPSILYVLQGKKLPSAGMIGQIRSFMTDYERRGEPRLVRNAGNAVINPTESAVACDTPTNFIRTRSAEVVIQALEYCARRRLNGAIFGDPGVGKSEALRYWSATTGYRHVIVFCRAYTSYLRLLQAIGRGLGLPHCGRSGELDQLIHEYLLHNPTMLIFDEADMLNARTLDWIRTVWDESGRRSNFALLGKRAFYKRLQLAHARSQQDLRQVWRRLAFRKEITGIDYDEMLQAVRVRGMDGAMDDACLKALFTAIGGSFGELDMMLELLEQMLAENPSLNGRISLKAVEKASRTRFGSEMGRTR